VTAQLAREHWVDTGWQPSPDAAELEDVLGPRPADREGRHRYERIELLHEAAHELDVGPEISLW
jgi:hypothetical protein